MCARRPRGIHRTSLEYWVLGIATRYDLTEAASLEQRWQTTLAATGRFRSLYLGIVTKLYTQTLRDPALQ
jgi:hypothetical protein